MNYANSFYRKTKNTFVEILQKCNENTNKNHTKIDYTS